MEWGWTSLHMWCEGWWRVLGVWIHIEKQQCPRKLCLTSWFLCVKTRSYRWWCLVTEGWTVLKSGQLFHLMILVSFCLFFPFPSYSHVPHWGLITSWLVYHYSLFPHPLSPGFPPLIQPTLNCWINLPKTLLSSH